MYQPEQFKEVRVEVLHQFITSHPFGLLISQGPEGILANGLPFILQAGASVNGILQAHLARANEHWRHIDGQPVLVVFQGPQAYISPSLYATKKESGKVVPTWNYVMVQARGVARVHQSGDWLMRQITALTTAHEQARPEAWAVRDAPEDYIASQLRGIVGLEIEITALTGKWKMSQNRPEADRRGVADGIADEKIARLVRERGGL
jgi:transcriptional regulator